MADAPIDHWPMTFRRQLVLADQKDVYDYWLAQRHGGALPCRADIDPARLKKHLPTVLLYDVLDDGECQVRLAGTGIRDVLDEEITGKRLSEIDFGEHQPYWQQAHHRVVTQKRPAQGVAPVTWRDKGNLFVFWLRLPLSSDGETVDKILGFDLYLAAAKVDAISRQQQRVNGAG